MANSINRDVNKTVESTVPTLGQNRSIPKLKMHNHSVLEGNKINSKISSNAGNQLFNLKDKIASERDGIMHNNRDTSNENPLFRAATKRKKAGMLRNFTHSVAH